MKYVWNVNTHKTQNIYGNDKKINNKWKPEGIDILYSHAYKLYFSMAISSVCKQVIMTHIDVYC